MNVILSSLFHMLCVDPKPEPEEERGNPVDCGEAEGEGRGVAMMVRLQII